MILVCFFRLSRQCDSSRYAQRSHSLLVPPKRRSRSPSSCSKRRNADSRPRCEIQQRESEQATAETKEEKNDPRAAGRGRREGARRRTVARAVRRGNYARMENRTTPADWEGADWLLPLIDCACICREMATSGSAATQPCQAERARDARHTQRPWAGSCKLYERGADPQHSLSDRGLRHETHLFHIIRNGCAFRIGFSGISRWSWNHRLISCSHIQHSNEID